MGRKYLNFEITLSVDEDVSPQAAMREIRSRINDECGFVFEREAVRVCKVKRTAPAKEATDGE